MSSYAPPDGWQVLVESAGLTAGPLELEPLAGGANNRTYAVVGATAPVVLKHYVRDERDRLGSEWAFLEYAWHGSVRVVPEPLGVDHGRSLALMGRLPGRRLAPGEVEGRHVEQAIRFISELQRRSETARLPDGAEACFDPSGHIGLVDRRVERLGAIEDLDAATFVVESLIPVWTTVRASASLALERIDAPTARLVSPSDFGFHNTLVDAQDVVRFHDFEYAGWDDGIKLVCDFFCQPEVPVPGEHFEAFAAAVPPSVAQRARVLLDVYRVKWCCIMLNDFLAAGAERRRYALGPADPERRRRRQLEKARAALGRIQH